MSKNLEDKYKEIAQTIHLQRDRPVASVNLTGVYFTDVFYKPRWDLGEFSLPHNHHVRKMSFAIEVVTDNHELTYRGMALDFTVNLQLVIKANNFYETKLGTRLMALQEAKGAGHWLFWDHELQKVDNLPIESIAREVT